MRAPVAPPRAPCSRGAIGAATVLLITLLVLASNAWLGGDGRARSPRRPVGPAAAGALRPRHAPTLAAAAPAAVAVTLAVSSRPASSAAASESGAPSLSESGAPSQSGTGSRAPASSTGTPSPFPASETATSSRAPASGSSSISGAPASATGTLSCVPASASGAPASAPASAAAAPAAAVAAAAVASGTSPAAAGASQQAAAGERAGLGCFTDALAPRVRPGKAAVFTCAGLHSVLAYEGPGAFARTRATLGAILRPWVDAGFAPVIMLDCGGSESATDGAIRSAVLASTARLVTGAEAACLSVRPPAAAGVLWAVLAGASEVANVVHPWPIAPAVMSLPAGSPAQVPGRKAATLAARPLSLSDHFTSASLARVQQAQASGGQPVSEDICNVQLVPTVQAGLCHEPASFVPGGHSTVAANEALASSDPAAAARQSGLLLEHVTPLLLPLGTPLELADAGRQRPAVTLAHRSAAWALLEGSESPGAAHSGSWSLALSGLLQAAGHAVTVLPPGRLCNVSLSPPAAAAGDAAQRVAEGVARAFDSAASAATVPLTGLAALSVASAALPAVAAAAQLTDAQQQRLRAWLGLVRAAYLQSGVGPAVDGDADTPDRALGPPLGPSPSHCWVDHANVRDAVLMLNFNNFLNTSRATLELLRRAYAPFYPLIVAFGMDGTMKEDAPELNAWRCAGEWMRAHGWPGGIVGQKCGAELVRRYPGHLGYAVVQDDVLWMPWNSLALDPHRVWGLNHSDPHYGHTDKSTWFYGCDRNKHAGTQWAHCYGCYTWHHDVGGKSVAAIHANFTPAQLAIKAANTGRDDGVSCDLTDAFYVPGALARPFAQLCDLFASAHTEVEMAYTTILDTLALRRDQETLRHFNSHARRNIDTLLEPWREPRNFDRRDPLHVLDWFHPLKLSNAEMREFFLGQFARAEAARLFTRPDMALLRARPVVSIGHLG